MFNKKRNCALEGHKPMDMEVTLYPGISLGLVCNFCGQPLQGFTNGPTSNKIFTVRVVDGKLEIL